MSKYLLLRNNKQAGPYTLDEIKTMNLKAYDLVWVEGKSAAWRYPGEIEEFKSFAPPVEEQPFDRFFKKPVQEDQSLKTSKQPATETEKSRYTPVASEQAATPATKSIYINLPAESKLQEEKKLQDYQEKKQPARERVIQWDVEPAQKSFSQSIPTAVEPVGGNEDLISPGEQLKKLYAQKELRQRKSQSPGIRQFIKPIAIGFGIVALLAAGIFIGLMISNRGLNSPKNNSTKEQNGVIEQQSNATSNTVPAKSSSTSNTINKSGEAGITEGAAAAVPDEKVLAEKRKLRAAKQRMADSLKALKSLPAKIDSTAFIAERDAAKKPVEAKDEKESIKNNIADYVALSASKFNVGTFGGISDLQLTVSNTSPFALDLVVVEVQYVQSNKKVFKTENLYYRNVNPGAAVMEEAPKSSRGVKVKYRITIISSKNIGISYSEL